MALEDYLRKGMACFDIEVKHWWTEKPIVYLIAIVSDKGDFVGGEFDIGSESLEAGGRTARYVNFRNCEEALVNWAGNKLYELDMPVIVTQNGLSYDYVVLAKRKGLFRLGPDNAEPKLIQAMRGVMTGEKRRSPASIDADLMWLARNNLDFCLPDYKIETISSLVARFFSAKGEYKKTLTYEEQKVDVEVAQSDKETARRLALYSYADAVTTFETGKLLVPILLNIAKTLQLEPFSVLNERRRKVVVQYESRRVFQNNNRTRTEHIYLQGLKKANLQSGNEKNLDEHTFARNLITAAFAPKFLKGHYKGVAVCHFQLSRGLMDVFAKDVHKAELYGCAAQSENPVEKIIYYKFLDEFVYEALIDILLKNERLVQKKYSGVRNCAELEERVKKGLFEEKKAIGDAEIINIAKGLLFIRKTRNFDAERLERAGITYWGDADIISVERGQVIYKIKDEVLSAGIKIPTLKRWQECDAPRDYTPNIEVKLLRLFIDNIFASAYEKALFEAKNIAKLMVENKISQTDYLQKIRCTDFPENLDDVEQQKQRNRIIAEFDAVPGEEIIFGVSTSPDGGEDFVRYDPITKSFDKPFIPSRQYYMEKIFGKNSKFRKITRACGLDINIMPSLERRSGQKTLF